MFGNEFLFRNTALMAALTRFPNLKRTPEEQVDEVMREYDNVSKEQVMKQYDNFSSKEEMEHYAHSVAVNNHAIKEWE